MRTFGNQFLWVIIIGVGFLGFNLFARAETASELQQKISLKTDEIQKLEQEIKQYQGDITTLNTKKKTLKNAIVALDITRKKLDADLRNTQVKVETTDLKLRQLGSEILNKEGEINLHIAALVEAIRALDERESLSLVAVALSQESFSGLWNDFETLNQFNAEIKLNVERLKNLKTGLEEKHTVEKIEKKNLLGLKTELGDRKKIAEDNKKTTAQILAQTSNKESAYAKILKQKIALKDAFEKELREYESTLKFILDPTSIPPRGTKVFSSPLDNLRITQYFGNTAFAKSGAYNGSGHNGVDFGVLSGTKVKSMLGGTVIGTGDTDMTCPGASYGKWVLVQHSNGLSSLYAHLSLITVSKNDTVSTGDIIGYSGNTGYSTGPHLHLTVFASAAVKVENRPSRACGGRIYTIPVAAFNAYLDPLDYL